MYVCIKEDNMCAVCVRTYVCRVLWVDEWVKEWVNRWSDTQSDSHQLQDLQIPPDNLIGNHIED
jgi:hypothetical protein